MAEPVRPLLVVTGDAAGICDPETGVCALPGPPAGPGPEAEPEPGVSPPSRSSAPG